ncbi:MAG: exodeoxyribonuclease VII small subunit [Actinomycetota bacterium]
MSDDADYDTSSTTDGNTISYRDALDELDEILARLEQTDVDVDHLADQVARASELIALCRARINDARVRITDVTSGLEADDR